MAMSRITVNGESMEAELPATIEVFLVSLGLRPKSVVAEHNGDAVAPSEFAARVVREGDRLEIARVVAGG
jgi:thiamine biosynthesis protein ThiS